MMFNLLVLIDRIGIFLFYLFFLNISWVLLVLFLQLLPLFLFLFFIKFLLLLFFFQFNLRILSCQSLITLSRVWSSNLFFFHFLFIQIFIEFFSLIRFNRAFSRFLSLFDLRKASCFNFIRLQSIWRSNWVCLIKILYFFYLTVLNLYFLNLILRLALHSLFLKFITSNRLISTAHNILIHWQISNVKIFLLFLFFINRILALLISPLFQLYLTLLKWIPLNIWLILYPKYCIIISSFIHLDQIPKVRLSLDSFFIRINQQLYTAECYIGTRKQANR